MSFFDSFFRKEGCAESVVLVDINATSVAGAYVRYADEGSPTILYTRRLPIEIRTGEAHERAMLRALELLGNDLIREGSPVLARSTGSGSVETILVSIDAPWQETSLRTEHFEQEEDFVFTRDLVEAKLKETDRTPSEKTLVDTSIIGTTLNGYETNNPYGRQVRRAAVIVLTSFIEQRIADSIIGALGHLYHTRRVVPIAGISLRYQAMRSLFPHERDAIILDATGGSTTFISIIRKGMFVTMVSADDASDSSEWGAAIMSELATLAKHYPLPRTIFLLAREGEMEDLQHKLDEAELGSLWLGDAPPRIVPVLKNLVGDSVRQLAENIPDTVLLLMTLFHQNRREKKEVSA